MKMYSGCRPMYESLLLLTDNNWNVNMSGYDEGSDWISATNEVDAMRLLWSPFSGRFFGETITGIKFDETSVRLDNQPWYVNIMDMLYLPQGETNETNITIIDSDAGITD